jgi:hypothetical protein
VLTAWAKSGSSFGRRNYLFCTPGEEEPVERKIHAPTKAWLSSHHGGKFARLRSIDINGSILNYMKNQEAESEGFEPLAFTKSLP